MNLFLPHDIASHVRENAPDVGVGVLWVAVDGERDPLKSTLDGLLVDIPVLVLVVRSRGFDDPNALLADLVSILNESRSHCEERLTPFVGCESFQIVLIAKKRLMIAQASSPVLLPSWFPIFSGRSIHAVVKDETWQLKAAVNDMRTGIPELNAAVYDLETSLLRRLRTSVSANPARAASLCAQLDSPPSLKPEACVAAFRTAHDSVANPASFRPSLKSFDSLVAQMWRIVQTRGTEQIGRPAAALAGALGITDDSASEWVVHFTGLLFRAASPQSASRVFAADVVLATAFSCQLSTAAAHADQYPRYPIPLLTSFGQMLLATLSDAIAFVDALE